MSRSFKGHRRIGGEARNGTTRVVCYAETGAATLLCGKGFGPRPNYSDKPLIVTCVQCRKALKRKARGLPC